METIKLLTGDTIRFDRKTYRVIGLIREKISLCRTDTDRLEIELYPTEYILDQISKGLITIDDRVESLPFRFEDLPDKLRNKYTNELAMLQEMTDHFKPLYKGLKTRVEQDFRKKLMEKYDISASRFWMITRLYLQNGFNPGSIIDRRHFKKDVTPNYKAKPGRKAKGKTKGVLTDEKVKEQFDYGIRCFGKNSITTFKAAYMEVLAKFYMEMVIENGVAIRRLPKDGNYPSYRQFVCYLKSKLSCKDIAIIRTSAGEYRNNKRIFYGDVLAGVKGPCDLWEVDAHECDFELVSQFDPTISIKRPTLYILIDVFTRMIMAFSLSFEINSNRGFANCMMNLLEDKDELCKRYGINAPKGFWPSRILPDRIRCDYGSEFISNDVERMCYELGIIKENVTPAMGSLKPIVEQFFHQNNESIKQFLAKNGYISKQHGSTHYEDAKLNIEEAKAIILTSIVRHNLEMKTSYPLNKTMIKEGLSRCPTPYELWNYGVNHCGYPRSVGEEAMFRYAMLEEYNARINRTGICFKNLSYISHFDTDLEKLIIASDGKKESIKIRIDTRDISYCYRLVDNQVVRTPLSEGRTDSVTFAGWSLPEYQSYLDQVSKAKDGAQEHNMNNLINATGYQKNILKQASARKSGKNSKKNINTNTNTEKELQRKKETIFDDDDFLIEGPKQDEKEKESENRIIDNMAEAIRNHIEKQYEKYYERNDTEKN